MFVLLYYISKRSTIALNSCELYHFCSIDSLFMPIILGLNSFNIPLEIIKKMNESFTINV